MTPVDLLEIHRLQPPSIVRMNTPWTCRGCDWTSTSLNGERAHANHLIEVFEDNGYQINYSKGAREHETH